MENEEKQNTDRGQREQGPTFRDYKDIVDHAHKEVEWVRSAYKHLIWPVAIVILVGIYFSYKLVTEFKDEVRRDVEEIKLDLSNKVNELAMQVQSRIDGEFKKENIHELVEEVAKHRIEEIADPLISQNIEEKINPEIKAAETKLRAIDDELTKAGQSREELKAALEFASTVSAAQNDDGLAFDQLLSWHRDKSFPFSAGSAIVKIRVYYASPMLGTAYVKFPWEKIDKDPSELTFSQLQDIYASMLPRNHADVINRIWNRTDISKKDKMPFLIDVLNKDKSLTARNFAGRFLAQEAGLRWDPFVTEPLLDWWKENKENIK